METNNAHTLKPRIPLAEELIEACRRQDRKAQLALYRKYARGMYTVALRMLRNEADAEDMTQEAFIRAFRKIDQFEGNVAFGAWLKRIVVNRCLDFLKVRQPVFEPLEEQWLSMAEEDEGGWEAGREVGAEEVLGALETLPEHYRWIVQLYLVEGYDHREISEILGLKETTCRTRLMRGKTLLREQLKHEKYAERSQNRI